MSERSETGQSVLAHLNLRRLIPVIVGAGVGLTINHYKEKGELAWFPDWGFDAVLFVVLFLGVYWVWTQADVQSAVRLAYKRRPKMLAVMLIGLGMTLGAGFGAFGFWRVRRYQQVHAIYHFSSHYMPVATNVPDHMFSFYPGPLSYCGEGKVSFGARIGFSKHDSMRRLVIDLPKGCEIETAKYAMQHRQEIKDRITEDMRNAEPDLLSGISIDRIVILSHRHILSNSAHMAIGKDTEGEYFVEGPTQD